MTTTLLLALVGLALVDSTSIGTLVLPLLMLVHPRVRADRVLIYLATLATFYFLLGVALLVSADAVTSTFSGLGDQTVVVWVQAVVGAGLLIGSFWPDTKWARERASARSASGAPTSSQRWIDKIVTGDGRPGVVVGVALVAGLIEAASMLPYLGALAMIGSSDLSLVTSLVLLAGYVLVMMVPAVLLLGARLSLRGRADALLERVATWVGDRVGGAMWWVIGIVGLFLLADAVQRLR